MHCARNFSHARGNARAYRAYSWLPNCALFRYVLNPRSASYVGHDTNQSNFQLVELD